ncbi:MAG TPA: SMC-Scp complex subunit ScpB, partial [Candidatus Moranbacteria bacterium]|nr:SMC-Scp complex subunit ScpB [Candidatus Moranbacteria bacterium]
MEKNKLKSVLESLLFVSGEPIKISKLAKIVEMKKEEVVEAISEISKKYREDESGLMIVEKEDEAQLVSSEKNVEYVERLVKNELEGPLSTAALEVLSIIAYRGPISKPEIESIRGVNCSYTLRNLSIRGLIERGNNPKDARGYVYSVSFDFLKKLGI